MASPPSALVFGRHRRPGGADRSTGLGRSARARPRRGRAAHGGRERALGSAVTGFTDRRVPHNDRTAELRPETIPSVATIDPTETTTTAGGRSAAITRRIAATARRPSATRHVGVENSVAARESEASVRALAAEELAHLVVELLHAGVDGRRLLDLFGGKELAYLEGGGQALAHEGGTGLRTLLHQRVEVVLRDGARAEQLVGDRLPGRFFVRAELGERRPVLPEDVMHSLLLVGAQGEGVKHAAPARQSTVAAGIATAHAVAERARAAGDRQRERAGRKEGLRH